MIISLSQGYTGCFVQDSKGIVLKDLYLAKSNDSQGLWRSCKII